MGSCVSSVYRSESSTIDRAKVISINGDLLEYSIPFTVSQVLLQFEISSASSSISSTASSSSYFLCNSDRLFYDDFIPALDNQDELQSDQIYFILPRTKLQYKLTASDMAALAVKASVALQKGSQSQIGRRRHQKVRISPVFGETGDYGTVSDDAQVKKSFLKSSQPQLRSSGSIRKMHRYSSRRAKMAVRSFRLRLTTIYEGSVL